MARPLTKEQKIAKQMTELVGDVTLDLDDIGKSIANANPTISYNRMVLIIEAAIDEKESGKEHLSLNNYLKKQGL